MSNATPALPNTLEEIRRLFADLPKGDDNAAQTVIDRDATLTKPPGSLGRLEELAVWLARWQGRESPQVNHPRTAVFAGNHGVAAKGVSAFPSDVTAQMVQNFIGGGAAVNQLCQLADADLRVYELDLETPTRDFSEEPAMDEKRCADAIAFGMMAVEPGLDLLALGEMGIGNTTSAAAICHLLYGGNAEDWTGAGTGVQGDALKNKIAVVEQAAKLHRDRDQDREQDGDPDGDKDGLDVLMRVGGLELCAIAGAILAARMAQTPVLLDGFICCAAAACLHACDPNLLDHCLVAHKSHEQAHQRLCEKLNQRPLLDLDMRLGEASGASLAILLCKAAVATHSGMATFEEAAVSNKAS